jgi:uncharacterized coiled-coil protein SlyX
MSMELWQRLKDLEKKVAEHGERLKSMAAAVSAPTKTMPWPTPEEAFLGKTLQQVHAGLVEDFKKLDELELRTPPDAVIRKPGPALCPKCEKAPGYYFHVKNCKGNADVA